MERRNSRVLYEASPPIDLRGYPGRVSWSVMQGLLDSSLFVTASPQISEQGGGDHILFSSHEHQICISDTLRPDSELSRKGNWEKL